MDVERVGSLLQFVSLLHWVCNNVLYGLLHCKLVYIEYMRKHPAASKPRPVLILLRLQTQDSDVFESGVYIQALVTDSRARLRPEIWMLRSMFPETARNPPELVSLILNCFHLLILIIVKFKLIIVQSPHVPRVSPCVRSQITVFCMNEFLCSLLDFQ